MVHSLFLDICRLPANANHDILGQQIRNEHLFAAEVAKKAL
jgi:hypothetical protein